MAGPRRRIQPRGSAIEISGLGPSPGLLTPRWGDETCGPRDGGPSCHVSVWVMLGRWVHNSMNSVVLVNHLLHQNGAGGDTGAAAKGPSHVPGQVHAY